MTRLCLLLRWKVYAWCGFVAAVGFGLAWGAGTPVVTPKSIGAVPQAAFTSYSANRQTEINARYKLSAFVTYSANRQTEFRAGVALAGQRAVGFTNYSSHRQTEIEELKAAAGILQANSPTADQKAALAGVSGTAVNASNKFLDDAAFPNRSTLRKIGSGGGGITVPSIGPQTDNSADLGSGSQKWRNLYYGGQAISSVPTGTAPATVASTTKVANWNSDLLDDAHLSTDGTFANNSDAKIPTEQAAKTYSDTKVAKESTASVMRVDEATATASTSTNYTPDLNTASTFVITVVGTNIVINAPTNVPASGKATAITFKLIQSDGSDTVTWNAAYKFPAATAPTLSTAAAHWDYVHCMVYPGSAAECTAGGMNYQ